MGSAFVRWSSLAAVLSLCTCLAACQWRFVDRMALNIMYWDQWDIYVPIFDRQSAWKMFSFQHGPHRQGLGALITAVLARTSGFDTRWDAFSICYSLMFACACALLLCFKCGLRHPIAMLAVPLLYFNIRNYENYLGAVNLSHGGLPMLLFTMLCLCWFIKNHALRTAVISLLVFSLIFTGFGLFVGLLWPVILLAEFKQARADKDIPHMRITIAGLVFSILAWVLFFHGYVPDSSIPNYHLPWRQPLECVGFVAMMLANFFAIDRHNPLAPVIGVVLIIALIWISIIHFRRVFRLGPVREPTSVVIFLLAAYAVIYCFFTAIGRVSLGWQAASLFSRYVTLMIPAGMAILLHIGTFKRRVLAVSLPVIYALLILPGAVHLNTEDQIWIYATHNRRIDWRNAYFVTRNQSQANILSHYSVYPRLGVIDNRLKWLDENRFNFFKDEPSPLR